MNKKPSGYWLHSTINRAINRYLTLDPETPAKFNELQGQVICIEILGFNKKLYLLPKREGIEVLEAYTAEPDATLSGTPAALFKLGLTDDAAPLLLKGEVEITGNMALGRQFKKILAGMQIDWEELLSKSIGDIPAHQATQALTKFSSWKRQSANTLLENISEYLQEETRDVISAPELEIFYRNADSLRDDVARFEARLDKFLSNT